MTNAVPSAVFRYAASLMDVVSLPKGLLDV